jgi:glycosyltransferase involved in cell wall biosynthesis
VTQDLRVAVVSDSTPERNGVGSYYADLVSQLENRVERAELFCPEDRSHTWQRYLAPPLPGDKTQKVWFPRPFKLWSEVTSLQPHVIVVSTPGPFGLIGLAVAKRRGIPLVMGFHTHYEALTEIYWSDLFGRIARRYLMWCHRLLFRNSRAVLAVSPEMAEQARRMGAEKPELIGTSVPSEFLARPLAPLSPVPRRVVFVGRLAEEKNIDQVVALARARPQLEVSIAGDGPMKAFVAEAAASTPNLAYMGWVPRERLIDVIDAHDALVLPSRVESFGTVALEALARGRLVILSGSCGITAWPQFDKCLFRIGDDESPTQAVDRVFALPIDVRANVGRLAHRAARDLNDWNLSTWIDRLRPQ